MGKLQCPSGGIQRRKREELRNNTVSMRTKYSQNVDINFFF